MKLNSYLVNGETVAAKARTVGDGTIGSGVVGCSKNRLVFASENGGVIDVSLRSVSAMKYSPPSFPIDYIVAAVLGFVLAPISFFVFRSLGQDGVEGAVAVSALTFAAMAAIGGFVLLAMAVSRRDRHELEVVTPAESFEFASLDGELEDVAHAIRANEP